MGMSKDRCPYNSFFGEKVMIKEKLSLIWGKFVNRETISYLIFGVLTTLVDWISYAVFRHNGMNYRMATICCQAAAILFAYVTNKIWVFRSYNFRPVYLLKEMASFFSCRILTSVFTYVAMIVMVDGMGIKQDMICKFETLSPRFSENPLYPYMSSFSGSMYFYNYETGRNDRIELKSEYSAKELSPYLSPSNTLTVKYVPEQTGEYGWESQLPRIYVVGRRE